MRIWLERLTAILGVVLAAVGLVALFSWSLPLSQSQRVFVAPIIVIAVAALTLFATRAIDADSWPLRIEMAAKGIAAGGCLWWGGWAVGFVTAIAAGYNAPYLYLASVASGIALLGALTAIAATFLTPVSRRPWTRAGGIALIGGGLVGAFAGAFPNPMPATASMTGLELFALLLVLMAAPAIVVGALLVASTMLRDGGERERPVGTLIRSLTRAGA